MKTALTARQSVKAIIVCLALWLPTAVFSETRAPHVCESSYDIFIDGAKAGEARQSRITGLPPAPSALRIDETSRFQAGAKGKTWNSSTNSTLEFTPEGINAFNHKISENDITFRVQGEIQGDELWASAQQVMTSREKKNREDNEFLVQTAAEFVPYLGVGLGVLGGILGSDGRVEGEVLIPLKDFDATLRGLPVFLRRNGYGAREEQLRLLDTEDLEVLPYAVELLGEEELDLAGKTFHCRIIRIKAPKKEIRYWIAEDEISAFLVKEQGEDEGVDYEILLRNYNPDTRK
jgi:hypothetical protein